MQRDMLCKVITANSTNSSSYSIYIHNILLIHTSTTYRTIEQSTVQSLKIVPSVPTSHVFHGLILINTFALELT